ncbi:hypothetical protein N7474_001682 [Penicillium riverlandense]|uniref:uncharacterized protein n=1 Tax=Penicillium riverlandense TaxID=1903569 RepID=UPI0025486C7A|nr:uncharacterized protein N7474_001682 [Penicillium riverlandense]KAJ5833371.1 hypothetical protein N7474_001682 [Penicillium riverlandense]
MPNTHLNSPTADVEDKDDSNQLGAKQDSKESAAEPTTERKKRTRTGCLNCSRGRRKCDEAKPMCTRCKRRGDKCQWRMLGSFRDANIKVLESDHPSMSQGGAVSKDKRQSRFKILNALPNNTAQAGESKTQSQKAFDEAECYGSLSSTEIQGDADGDHNMRVDYESPPGRPSAAEVNPHSVASLLAQRLPGSGSAAGQGLSPPLSSGESTNYTNIHETSNQPEYRPSISSDPSPHTHINSTPVFVVDEVTASRDSPQDVQFHSSVADSYQSVPSSLFDNSVFSDPADFVNDVFLPGTAYEALHTTLRNRQLWTARLDVPSRRSSPDSVPFIHTPEASTGVSSVARTETDACRSGTDRLFKLSPQREHVLWQNYLTEICSWLDMFDSSHHFASTFPQMAKSAPHLRYSILSLSARQLERQKNEKSQSESLSLYQEAIHLLLPELESKTTPVIASCVILCVLEMLSCNPKEWRRHLDGCAYLIQAAGINGFSGKEEQALFWCFARMDVCGGLISEEETIIPIHNWRPSDMSAAEASRLFLSSAKSNFDTYANYTVYLSAETVGLLFGWAAKMTYPCTSCQSAANEDGTTYIHRWEELFGRVEQWYESRPSQMKSIFNFGTPGHGGKDQPFPTVIYGNGAASKFLPCHRLNSSNLISDSFWKSTIPHLRSVIASEKAQNTDSVQETCEFLRSVLWHSRKICAISASNAHHGCWTNALQPLWIAGKVMSHHSEHQAIIETLIRIERDTGWATAWRVEDLKEFWGEYDNDEDECGVDVE